MVSRASHGSQRSLAADEGQPSNEMSGESVNAAIAASASKDEASYGLSASPAKENVVADAAVLRAVEHAVARRCISRGNPPLESHPAQGLGEAVAPVVVPVASAASSEITAQWRALMRRLLGKYVPEDAVQPEPVSFGQAWIYVAPACSMFHRCSVCVDKLGASIGPLDLNSEVGRMTESLHWPVSAVVDVVHDATFEIPAAASHKPPTSGAATGLAGVLRRAMPFARACFRGSGGTDSQEAMDAVATPSASSTAPPYPHILRVRIRPALAGRAFCRRQEGEPASQQQQPICIWLCFSQQAEAESFAAKVMAYKKHHVAITLLTYIKTLAVFLEREDVSDSSSQLGSSLAELPSGQGQPHRLQNEKQPYIWPGDAQALPEPPLPRRPSNIPPPSLLPRILANDEGEVFWFMPRKQPPGMTSDTDHRFAGLAPGQVSPRRPPPPVPTVAWRDALKETVQVDGADTLLGSRRRQEGRRVHKV